MRIWKVFTRLWTSVQKYLSINWQRISGSTPAQRPHFVLIALVPVVLVLILAVIVPVWTVERGIAANDPMLRELTAARSELVWLTARQQNARTDSLSLSLNLVDSTLVLEIRGVTLRVCPVRDFRISGPGLATDSLATPFELQSYRATTEKIPIVVKKAPKDTVEAAKELLEPVLPVRDDVYAWLHFNRQLELIIRQSEAPGFTGWMKKNRGGFVSNIARLADAVGQLAHLQFPRVRREVIITIDREDARAIYRALPEHAALAVLLPAVF
jgi:hypothetical protein